jgi:nucleoside phosphorylase
MKILIVDDTLAKLKKLISAFVEDGISRDSISVVSTAMMARTQLRSTVFDLLVLDLLLPLREEDEPLVKTSLDLLRDINEREEFFKPKRIVGFTAFEEVAQVANPIFNEMLWGILLYSDNSLAWRDAFRNTVNYLVKQSTETQPPAAYDVDLCLVTALPSPEMDAVHRNGWDWNEPAPMDDLTFVREGRLTVRNETFSVVSASASRMGSVAAALLASKLVEKFRPRFLVMAGICAGVRGKTQIGDAILFDPTWEWPSGKLIADENSSYLEPAPHQIPTAEFVTARFAELSKDAAALAKVRAAWPSPPPSALRILVGPGASGSAVVADKLKVEEIQAQHRKLTGLDMEAYGVHAAGKMAPMPRPTVLVVKSVCDFADERKNNKWQAYAAYTSAAVMTLFVERYLPSIRQLAGS